MIIKVPDKCERCSRTKIGSFEYETAEKQISVNFGFQGTKLKTKGKKMKLITGILESKKGKRFMITPCQVEHHCTGCHFIKNDTCPKDKYDNLYCNDNTIIVKGSTTDDWEIMEAETSYKKLDKKIETTFTPSEQGQIKAKLFKLLRKQPYVALSDKQINDMIQEAFESKWAEEAKKGR